MSNTISPADAGASKGRYASAAGNGVPTGGVSGGSRLGSNRPVAVGGTAPSNLGNQIGQLLQALGGDSQNSQMLPLLIGLMILMTLLEGSSQGGGSPTDALSQLGGASGGQGGLEGLAASATSITIEHTSVTMTSSFVESMAADEGSGQGQTLDEAA